MTQVACNPMAYRQTPRSRFSHFQAARGEADSFAVLESVVEAHLDARRPLNPEGTIAKLVLPIEGVPGSFFSGVIPVDAMTVFATRFAVREGGDKDEAPFMQTVAVGSAKTPAKRVEVILYHVSALKESERTYIPAGASEPVVVDAPWQIVSVNCQATETPEPPTPQAMARNMAAALGLPEGKGGTARTFTAEEFMRSILFWSQHAMCEGSDN